MNAKAKNRLFIKPQRNVNVARLIFTGITLVVFYFIVSVDPSEPDDPHQIWLAPLIGFGLIWLMTRSQIFVRTVERMDDTLLFYNKFFQLKLNQNQLLIDSIKNVCISQDAKNYYLVEYELVDGEKIPLGRFAVKNKMEPFEKVARELIKSHYSTEEEQAVIVRFRYGINGLEPLHILENELEAAIDSASVGEYDGHEIAVDYSDGFLYMYGPNAELLFKTVEPILRSSEAIKNGVAKLRFGPPEDGVSEIEVEL